MPTKYRLKHTISDSKIYLIIWRDAEDVIVDYLEMLCDVSQNQRAWKQTRYPMNKLCFH